MLPNKVTNIPLPIKLLCMVLGAMCIELATTLFIKGEFTFKGTYYSFIETPLMFYLQTSILLLLGGYLVIFPLKLIFDDRNN